MGDRKKTKAQRLNETSRYSGTKVNGCEYGSGTNFRGAGDPDRGLAADSAVAIDEDCSPFVDVS